MLKPIQLLIFLLFSSASIASDIASEKKVLTLVYKDVGNPPYMQVAPDNSGLYLELMTLVVEKIGYKLKVLRPPKKRGYKQLQLGLADLYASGEFRENRSRFLFYFPNGLHRIEKFYGLTSMDIPDIYSISDINQYRLTWIFEAGSSWPEQAKYFDVKYLEIKEPTIEKALSYLRSNRSVFFKVEKNKLTEFTEKHQITSLQEKGVKVHQYCCKSHTAPLYTGFSRSSPFYQEQINPMFDNSLPLSPENYPFMLTPGSVPDQLKNALQLMIDSGEIEALKLKYKVD